MFYGLAAARRPVYSPSQYGETKVQRTVPKGVTGWHGGMEVGM